MPQLPAWSLRDRENGMLTPSSFDPAMLIVLSSFVVPANKTDHRSPHEVIQGIVRYYVMLGFLSIFFYWVAWVSWITAAERQVRRIRFVRCRESNRSNWIDRLIGFSFALFRNILRQEIGYFDVHNAGELSNRLIDDLGKTFRMNSRLMLSHVSVE